jgi:hypothetical protein
MQASLPRKKHVIQCEHGERSSTAMYVPGGAGLGVGLGLGVGELDGATGTANRHGVTDGANNQGSA